MDILELITDITTENNINYGNLEKYNGGFIILNIYNPNISIPLHKFWFYIENVKIIKIKNNIIDIALSEIHNKILINYINNLELNIQHYINNNINKKPILKKTIQISNTFFPIMKLKLDENSILYNDNDELIEKKLLQENNFISLFIELNNVIINNNIAQWWLSFSIIQIKQNKLFDRKKSLFLQKNINLSHQQPLPPPLPLPLIFPSQNINKLNKIIDKPHNITRLNISTTDIVSQLGKLKKINNYQNNLISTNNSLTINPKIKINDSSNESFINKNNDLLNDSISTNNSITINPKIKINDSSNESFINKNNDLLNDSIINKNDELLNESFIDKNDELLDESFIDKNDELLNDSIINKNDELLDDSIINKNDELLDESFIDKNDELLDGSFIDKNDELLDESFIDKNDDLINNKKNKKNIKYNDKEKQEKFMIVMDEMINKIIKKNKRIDREIMFVDNIMNNI
jgi:hypothetical protein